MCVEASVSNLGAATQRAAAQADEKEERKPAREAREKPPRAGKACTKTQPRASPGECSDESESEG